MTDVIKFYIRENPYGFLSNFWRLTQKVDSDRGDFTEYYGVFSEVESYPTNEHYYQSMKAANSEISSWIASAPTAKLAMKAGRMLSPEETYVGWDRIKVFVMLKGLRAKFSDPSLKLMLDWTSNAILIEDSPTDMFWGGSLPGSQNMLGRLLMHVREENRTGERKEFKQ
jgi:ribA/ribD-fused uncharacterized protein